MESDASPDRSTAAADLAVLRADRVQVARRMAAPWWIDGCLGLAVFLVLSANSLRDTGAWRLLPLAAGLALLWAAASGYRRVTGAWVNGLRRGRTRRAVAVWLAVYAVVVAVGSWAEFALGWRGAMAVAGAVLGVAIVVVDRWWMRLYVAELREGL